jgi:hypothetical protein
MNRLSEACRADMIRALVEGNSIRSTARMTGADKETVMRLLPTWVPRATSTRAGRYAIWPAPRSSATRFGHSSERRRRTSPTSAATSAASVMSTPGSRSTPTASSP